MRRWLFFTEGGGKVRIVHTSAAVSDEVALWRAGSDPGIVAIGTIVGLQPVIDELAALGRRLQEPGSDPDERPVGLRATARYDRTYLSNPLTGPVLRRLGLGEVWRRGRSGPGVRFRPPFPGPLRLDDDQWNTLIKALADDRPDGGNPRSWVVEPGTILSRSDVRDAFGAGLRSVETSSSRLACDLLFVNDRHEDPLLMPRWSEDVLLVPGQERRGSVIDSDGTTLVADHVYRGRPLHLFQTREQLCRYVGEFLVDQARPIEEWIDTGRRRVRPPRRSFMARATEAERPAELQDFRAPVLRLRQLSGLAAFTGQDDPFDGPVVRSHGLRTYLATDLGVTARDAHGVGTTVQGLVRLLQQQPDVAAVIEDSINELQALAALTENARRRSDLDALRKVVADPDSKEADLQKALERMTWVFGGQFLSTTGRRNLTATDQLDLALIRPDRSLHGVELKLANISPLIKPDHESRGYDQYVVSAKVSDAAGQAKNYLKELDRERDIIWSKFGIDTKSAGMTVVIGSAAFAEPKVRPHIAETLRTYNEFLSSRIRVITYDQLIDDAERASALADVGYIEN